MKRSSKVVIVILLVLLIPTSYTPEITGHIIDSQVDLYSGIDISRSNFKLPLKSQDLTNVEFNFPTSQQIVFFDEFTSFASFQQEIQKGHYYPNLQAVRIDIKDLLDVPISEFQISHIYSQDVFQKMNLHNIEIDNVVTDLVDVSSLQIAGFNGSGIVVGVLDNGIDFNHPLLSGKRNGSYFAGYPGIDSCGTHGTPVSGLIAGSAQNDFTGMAPGSKLFDINFSCSGASIEGDFLAAFEKVIELNETISIINTSFGGFAPSWDPIMKRLAESGIIVVGSAGNSGPSLHTTTTGGPGNSIHSISVGATTSSGDLTQFSSVGPAHETTYKPDLLAPGSGVLSTVSPNDLIRVSGTSFSSPIVAGGIASLLEALNYYNINYNPGLIKAALLETAQSIGLDPIRQGQGIVKFSNALDLILNENSLDPRIVNLSPNNTKLIYHDYFPRGMDIVLPVNLVSSHPSEINLSFGGDLSGKIVDYQLSNSYSQQLRLNIDSTQFSQNQNVSATITATVGNYSSTIELNFKVGLNKVGTIGVDRIHTYWDQFAANHIGGSNIGLALYNAMLDNYEVVEINQRFSSTTLSDVDILWMADTLNIVNQTTLFEEGFSENGITATEIQALRDFISSGNSILATTMGYQQDQSGNIQFGLDTDMFNDVFGYYGITAKSSPSTIQTYPFKLPMLNVTSLVGSSESITYAGNTLELSGNAWQVSGYGNISGMAYYQDPDSFGKILISSTNYWIDNVALSSGYRLGTDDKNIAGNLWDWMNDDSQIVKLSETIQDSQLSGSFLLPDTLDETSLELFVVNDTQSEISKTPIPFQQTGSIYTFNHEVSTEGQYNIIAEVGDEYVGWHYIRDLTGPSIIPRENTKNNSNFADDAFTILSFHVFDEISGIDEESLDVYLDGNPVDFVTSFNDLLETLDIIVPTKDVTKKEWHILTISLADNVANYNTIKFRFSVGGLPIDTSSDKPISNESQGGFLTYPILTWSIIPVVIKIISNKNKPYLKK